MDKTASAHSWREIQLIKLTSKDSMQCSWYASEWLLSVLPSDCCWFCPPTVVGFALLNGSSHTKYMAVIGYDCFNPENNAVNGFEHQTHMRSKYNHTHELLVWLCQAALENTKIACLCVCLYVSIIWLRNQTTFIRMPGTCRPCIKNLFILFVLVFSSAFSPQTKTEQSRQKAAKHWIKNRRQELNK